MSKAQQDHPRMTQACLICGVCDKKVLLSYDRASCTGHDHYTQICRKCDDAGAYYCDGCDTPQRPEDGRVLPNGEPGWEMGQFCRKCAAAW
jgi:hypothetical protein